MKKLSKRRMLAWAVALLILPVLAVPAMAAEIYEFEYIEMPIALNESFDFIASGGSGLFMEGFLPAGIYHMTIYNGGKVVYVTSDPISLSFDLEEDGVHYSFFSLVIPGSDGVGVNYDMGCTHMDDLDGEQFTLIGFLEGRIDCTSAVLTRVGDLPGSVVSSDDFIAVFEPFKEQISVKSAVGVLACSAGGSAGLGFTWWGLKKSARLLMAAFRNGRFKL